MNKSENKKSFEEILVKVVSPKFEINYSLSMSELSNRIDKMIKYSEIDKKKILYLFGQRVFSQAILLVNYLFFLISLKIILIQIIF